MEPTVLTYSTQWQSANGSKLSGLSAFAQGSTTKVHLTVDADDMPVRAKLLQNVLDMIASRLLP